MSDSKKIKAIIYAFLAAVFYALNVPFSKLLMQKIPPVTMAGLLYLGAGLGVGFFYLFKIKKEAKEERLSKADLPYAILMVVLDVIAPILLMLGIRKGNSSEVSLLGNFEIVATTLIALAIFKEKVSGRLWSAILFITAASIILSFESAESFSLSIGSLFVLGATVCWGLENNCTRRISEKSTYQIVTIKGLGSGFGSMLVAFISGEFAALSKSTAGLESSLQKAGQEQALVFVPAFIPLVLLLGFVAYGLSIFTYVRAQRDLGAAKTSAFYAVAPFVGSFLSFVFVGEKLTWQFLLALLIMILGTYFVVADTLEKEKFVK